MNLMPSTKWPCDAVARIAQRKSGCAHARNYSCSQVWNTIRISRIKGHQPLLPLQNEEATLCEHAGPATLPEIKVP